LANNKLVMDYEVVVIGDMDSPHDAIRSLLQTTLTHVADFQNMILKIISEKYGHSMDELVAVIKDDETFQKSLGLGLGSHVSKEFLKTKKGKKIIVRRGQENTEGK
jgi:hypothetical protein